MRKVLFLFDFPAWISAMLEHCVFEISFGRFEGLFKAGRYGLQLAVDGNGEEGSTQPAVTL